MVWNLMFPWFYSTTVFLCKMCQTVFLLFNHMGLSQNSGAAIDPMVWNRKSSQRKQVNDPHFGPTQMSCWWTISHHIITIKHTSCWWIPFAFDQNQHTIPGSPWNPGPPDMFQVQRDNLHATRVKALQRCSARQIHRRGRTKQNVSCYTSMDPVSLLADCLSQEKSAGAGWSSSHPRGTSVFWSHCRYLLIQSSNPRHSPNDGKASNFTISMLCGSHI